MRSGGNVTSRTGDGSRASAGAGRRTGEESGAPVAYGGAFVACRGGRAELNQDDEGGSNRDWNDGVENDAERAVVGVGFQGMNVRHLDDGEERKQDEAQDSRRHRNGWPGEDGQGSSWLELLQNLCSVL